MPILFFRVPYYNRRMVGTKTLFYGKKGPYMAEAAAVREKSEGFWVPDLG